MFYDFYDMLYFPGTKEETRSLTTDISQSAIGNSMKFFVWHSLGHGQEATMQNCVFFLRSDHYYA